MIPRLRHPPRRGFTLIEMMVVVAVMAILATLALPSFQDRIVRAQIVEAAKLADIAKAPVAATWTLTAALPADNAAAGLPAADKVVGNLVSAVTIEAGAIHMTFGNQANGAIRGKTLSFRPAVIPESPVVPVAWVCGFANAPEKMTVNGVNRTDVDKRFLPLNCR